ncbi:hypothetical protein pdam_00015258, partial [Pocillopora damicornis]
MKRFDKKTLQEILRCATTNRFLNLSDTGMRCNKYLINLLIRVRAKIILVVQKNCMVDSKENYKFDLGVKGFTDYLHPSLSYTMIGSLDNAIQEFSLAKPSWVMSYYRMHVHEDKFMQ